MYLVGWFAVGFILASMAMHVARQSRRERDATPAQASLLVSALVAAVLLYAARSKADRPQPAPAAEETPPAEAAGGPSYLAIFALAIAFLLLILLAVASDGANLWNWLLWLRSPFLGVRFQSLLWGVAAGVVTQIFRVQIAERSRQAFDATIGNKENTAWVLQGTLAILIIVAAGFAIKPDLLAYLRSLEYGGFKATFGEHSSTARGADLQYKELLWGFTLGRYEQFDNYIGEESDRAVFGDLFFNYRTSKQKRQVTAALFTNYVQPVMKSLVCLEKKHPIKSAATDAHLIRYGARWVTFLWRLKSEPSEPTIDSVKQFLTAINDSAHGTRDYVNSIVPRCGVSVDVMPGDIERDAQIIVDNYGIAVDNLKKDNKTNPAFRTLAIVDPYLFSAVADLIAVLNGQKDKAEFLTRMREGFPKSSEMMTPGIVNIFYQMADAQLKSFESWPVDTILANLDFAIKGIDLLISRTSDLVAEKASPHGRDPTRFFAAMNRNLMILLAEKLGLFNQRALAGEALSQTSREDWLRTYSRMIANSAARSEAPLVALDNLPAAAVNEQSRMRWPHIKIESEYQLDINLATAISSILLEGPGRGSALSCNTALYYLNRATANVDSLLEERREEADKAEQRRVAGGSVDPSNRSEAASRDMLAQLQLKRILTIFSNWAGSSCDWKRESG